MKDQKVSISSLMIDDFSTLPSKDYRYTDPSILLQTLQSEREKQNLKI